MTAPLDRSDFLLKPDVAFLNHGSFGACPKPVFERYQELQRELEWQPVLLLGRQIEHRLREAIEPLAAYVNAPAESCIFVENATTGVNIVARSLKLEPGDEILATEHEYGACSYAWQYQCDRQGAYYRQPQTPWPLSDPDSFVDSFWASVTANTRLIFISHITSPTGLLLPIEAILRRARAEGIMTLVDGAHAPAHVAVDVAALDADFYTGNCHKWMCSPKGAGFLYARHDVQHLLQPAVISWGFPREAFAQRVGISPTRDPSAMLAVPAALKFMQEHHWQKVQTYSQALAKEAAVRLRQITGQPAIADASWFRQMVTVALPDSARVDIIKSRLYDEFAVEVPVHSWNGHPLLRLSVQGYTQQWEIDRLCEGLEHVLSDESG
jgi:isopenicillin-N epimerase